MSQPDYHTFDEFTNRVLKVKEIESLGIDPYPHTFKRTSSAHEIQLEYSNISATSDDGEKGTSPLVSVSGRLVLFRAMGKNAFAQIQDEDTNIQVMFNRDLTRVTGLKSDEISHLKFIEKKLDLGDIVGIKGHLFTTKKGELTLFAKEVTLLTKTLLSLPDKHAGLQDKGVRYKKRWLDLISNKDVMATFKKRSDIVKNVRIFCDTQGFMEVETPVIQNSYGGAEADPFKTHINALKQDAFLRISLELPLKKLIVGGFLKVFEIGKVFRNEGLDRTHNPEFTELELYAAYWDYNDIMEFTENLFETLALKVNGSTTVTSKIDSDKESIDIDLKAPWIRLTMKESIKKYAGITVDDHTDAALIDLLIQKGINKEDTLKPRGNLIQMIFEEYVEHHLIAPHFITDHPIETTPLCKLHRNPEEKEKGIIERFEAFIGGYEFCNAYSELNDPIKQRELLVKQSESKKDEETPPLDEEFIESICQGMPPTGGLGIGIDRLIMLLTSSHSIKDVLLFPMTKSDDE